MNARKVFNEQLADPPSGDLPSSPMISRLTLLVAGLLLLTACEKPDPPTIGLYLAVQRGDIDQIERHIKWGSDMEQADAEGRRPLHLAADKGRYVIAKVLVRNGAEIDALDLQGRSPLHAALMSGRTQVAELLIRQGARTDADQLLEQVVANGVADRDVVELLLQQGADINHVNAAGLSPLLQAIANDDRLLVKILIGHGADVNQPSNDGRVPLALATERQNGDIIRLLQRNGARLP